jgi:hypothetical protein
VDCIDSAEHWRQHREVLEWVFRHASQCEARAIRNRLEAVAPDFESADHAAQEAREWARQLFSYDPPAVKAREGLLLLNAAGGAPELDPGLVEELRQGARVEAVAVVSDTLAWVHLTWEDTTGQSAGDSQAVVRCGQQWCLRMVPFPEDARLLPAGFPRPSSNWGDWIEASGKATLEMWSQFLNGLDGGCR